MHAALRGAHHRGRRRRPAVPRADPGGGAAISRRLVPRDRSAPRVSRRPAQSAAGDRPRPRVPGGVRRDRRGERRGDPQHPARGSPMPTFEAAASSAFSMARPCPRSTSTGCFIRRLAPTERYAWCSTAWRASFQGASAAAKKEPRLNAIVRRTIRRSELVARRHIRNAELFDDSAAGEAGSSTSGSWAGIAELGCLHRSSASWSADVRHRCSSRGSTGERPLPSFGGALPRRAP